MFAPQVVKVALWYLYRFINIAILVRIVLQWFNLNPSSPIVQFIYGITEPILAPVRNLINNIFGYTGFIDFSPWIAMILLQVLYGIAVGLL